MEKMIIKNPTGTPVNFSSDTAEVVTTSDSTVFTRGQLFVGVGGDIAVKFANQATTVVFKNIQDGTFMPINVVAVLATGTTATDIVILR